MTFSIQRRVTSLQIVFMRPQRLLLHLPCVRNALALQTQPLAVRSAVTCAGFFTPRCNHVGKTGLKAAQILSSFTLRASHSPLALLCCPG